MRCAYLVLVLISIVCCVTSVALYHGKRDAAMNNSQIAGVYAHAPAEQDHGEPLKSTADKHERYVNHIVKKEIKVPDNLLPDKTNNEPTDDKMHPDNATQNTNADENEKKTTTNEKTLSDEKQLRYDLFMDASKSQNLNDAFLDDSERKRDFGPFSTNIPDMVGDVYDMQQPIVSVQSARPNAQPNSLAQNTEKIFQLAQALIQNSNFMENRPDQSNRYKNKNLFLVDGKELEMDDHFKMPASYDERKQQLEQEREKQKQLQDFQDQEMQQLKGFRDGQPQAPAAVEQLEGVEVENDAAPAPPYTQPMSSIIKFANMLLYKVGLSKEKTNSRKQRTNMAYNPNMDYLAGPNSIDNYDLDTDDYLYNTRAAIAPPPAPVVPAVPSQMLAPFPIGLPNIANSADVPKPLAPLGNKPLLPMPNPYQYILTNRNFKDQDDDFELRCPVHREAKKKSTYNDEEYEDEQPAVDGNGGGLVCSCRYIKNKKRC